LQWKGCKRGRICAPEDFGDAAEQIKAGGQKAKRRQNCAPLEIDLSYFH
jgi:hypothetical protein